MCHLCRGDVSNQKSTRECGVIVELRSCYYVCGDIDNEQSSQRVEGSANWKPFEINILAARAVQATGNGQTALNNPFSTMGISRKTYQAHIKATFRSAATLAVEGVTNCKNCPLEAPGTSPFVLKGLRRPGGTAVSHWCGDRWCGGLCSRLRGAVKLLRWLQECPTRGGPAVQ